MRYLLLAFTLVPSVLFAAAYVPDKGHGLAILGVNSYEARSLFGSDKTARAFSDNGKFSKTELSYYLTYALRNDLAIIASGVLLNELSYKNDFSKSDFKGAGDQYLAARYFLRKDSDGAEALQAGVGLPVYSKAANPAPGNRQNDFEARYLRDHFRLLEDSFFSWELAYRFRNSTPSDQLRADLSFGKTYDKWTGMLHANAMKGLKNQSGKSSSVNPNTAADFDLYKLGASVAYKFFPEHSVQLGITQDVFGRNTGKGRGFFLALWRSF